MFHTLEPIPAARYASRNWFAGRRWRCLKNAMTAESYVPFVRGTIKAACITCERFRVGYFRLCGNNMQRKKSWGLNLYSFLTLT